MIIHDMRSPCVSIKLGFEQAKKVLEEMSKTKNDLDSSILTSCIETVRTLLAKRKSNLDVWYPEIANQVPLDGENLESELIDEGF